MKRAVLLLGCVAIASCSLGTDLNGLSNGNVADGGANGPPVPAGDASADAGTTSGGPLDPSASNVPRYVRSVLLDRPISYYRFEETGGTIAKDVMGRNDGTFEGPVELAAPGALPGEPASRSLHFAGIDGARVVLGDVFDFANGDAFTIELWFKPDAIDTEYRRLLWKSNLTGPSQGWWISFEQVAFMTMLCRRDDRNSAAARSGPIPLDTWSHIAVVYDGTNLALYRNATLVSFGEASTNMLDTTEKLYVGSLSSGFNPLKGSIDELAFYDQALDEARLKLHIAAANP